MKHLRILVGKDKALVDGDGADPIRIAIALCDMHNDQPTSCIRFGVGGGDALRAVPREASERGHNPRS